MTTEKMLRLLRKMGNARGRADLKKEQTWILDKLVVTYC